MASGDGGLQPHVMAILARQLRQLSTAPPPGVRYVPSDASLTEVVCELEGPRGTPYEGGSFTCRLVLGSDFPNAPPKGASPRPASGRPPQGRQVVYARARSFGRRAVRPRSGLALRAH